MPGNADFRWDEFDAVAYLNHNYVGMRDDDRALLEFTRDFFSSAGLGDSCDAGDVGAGTNLYPALAMLPWSKRITLVEHSARNQDWLDSEIHRYSDCWDPFWDLLRENVAYEDVTDPRAALASRAEVTKGSIFDLPRWQWDLGTMFFVAESISPRPEEFEAAVAAFVGTLRPGAPFAAAFMENSEGYDVGDLRFPAVKRTEDDVQSVFKGRAKDVRTERLGLDHNPVRAGYTGMIFASGWATGE